jgi:hypothetical protein
MQQSYAVSFATRFTTRLTNSLALLHDEDEHDDQAKNKLNLEYLDKASSKARQS